MSAVLERCALAGIRLWMEGPALRYDAPKGAMTEELAADIKANKPAIVKALGQAPASKRRGLGGYGTPPGVPPLGDCALAQQIAAMPEGDLVPGNEVPAMPGVSPEFAARLSAEDLEDIEAGDVPPETVQAFEAAAIAREAEDLKQFFEERAGILQHDAGLPRPAAELEAARSTANMSDERLIAWYWRSDRYDPLDGRYGGTYLAPASDGIDAVRAYLEKFFGVQITELRRPGGRVLRQGAGAQEVKA